MGCVECFAHDMWSVNDIEVEGTKYVSGFICKVRESVNTCDVVNVVFVAINWCSYDSKNMERDSVRYYETMGRYLL